MKTAAFKLTLISTSFIALTCASGARADNFGDLLTKGKVFDEVRYRYENVDQAGLAHDTGTANTVRANIGFETGSWENFKGLAELQTVQHIGSDNYNDTTNGKTTYPTIADPKSTELEQAWLQWAGRPDASIKAGRQIINLDNQRFIGSVNWRQTDQTFDAGTIAVTPLDRGSLSYTYLWRINRTAGQNSATPDYTGNTHLFHGEYAYADWLKIIPYDYAIDISQSPGLSSNTYGLQLTGKGSIDNDWKFQYLAEYARQSGYGNNPNSFSENYYHVTPSVMWGNITLQPGFESLGGAGTASHAFQTPLATLHAFNGWADKFLTTPANGLDDAYLRAACKFSGIDKWVDGTTADVVYHDFRADHTSATYGKEWDYQLAKTFKPEGFITKEITLTAAYADYNADTLYTDTKKIWFMVGTKF